MECCQPQRLAPAAYLVIVYVCRVNEALSILACVACACMHVARACARAGLLVRVSARCFGVCTCICRGRMCARVGASVRNFAASERRSAAKEARSDRRPIAPAQTRARPSTHAHMCVRVCTIPCNHSRASSLFHAHFAIASGCTTSRL